MLKQKAPRELINEINRILDAALEKGIATAALKYEVPKTVLAALKQNTFVFSGMKGYHELKQASLLLLTDKGEIKPFETFKLEVQSIYEAYNVNYLNAEYNFAIHSAQTASKWQDFKKDGDRYNLQFRTAADSKVRADHAALANTTLASDDVFWRKYVPPLGWNCRCTVVQVMKDKYPLSDSTESIDRGLTATTNLDKDGVNKSAMFRTNPGETLNLFPEKHPYMARDGSPKDVKDAQKIIEKME